jgi:hypothetical protein
MGPCLRWVYVRRLVDGPSVYGGSQLNECELCKGKSMAPAQSPPLLHLQIYFRYLTNLNSGYRFAGENTELDVGIRPDAQRPSANTQRSRLKG